MKFLFYGPAIFISFLFLFFLFDHKGTCLENGGVWDEKAKRCRYDCLLWTHKTGCVWLYDAVLAALDRCGHDAKCHDHVLEKVLPGLCLKYKGKYDSESNSCNFEETADLNFCKTVKKICIKINGTYFRISLMTEKICIGNIFSPAMPVIVIGKIVLFLILFIT